MTGEPLSRLERFGVWLVRGWLRVFWILYGDELSDAERRRRAAEVETRMSVDPLTVTPDEAEERAGGR